MRAAGIPIRLDKSLKNVWRHLRAQHPQRRESARELGAEGIVGIDFDYEVLGEANGMMMVAVSGTAVKIG